MLKIVARVKHWWAAERPVKPEAAPFAVPCGCGKVVAGQRQAAAQVIACAQCGARVFVFPRSPLPPVLVPKGRAGAKTAPSQARQWRTWQWLAGAGAILALTLGVVLWVILATPEAQQHQPERRPQAADVAGRLAAARVELGQGKFYTALEKLDPDEDGLTLPANERREWEQVRRQARLFAELSEVPLQDILRQVGDATLPQGEWQLVFQHRYRGKAIILDAEVGRDAGGKWRVEHFLFVGDQQARIEIGELDLLGRLPLDQPQRLIVGARLAGVGQEPNRSWVVHLLPDSGVLLTEQKALEVCCPALRDDRELPALLKRQRDWWAKLPRAGASN